MTNPLERDRENRLRQILLALATGEIDLIDVNGDILIIHIKAPKTDAMTAEAEANGKN